MTDTEGTQGSTRQGAALRSQGGSGPMKNPLEGMTQDRWDSLTPMERDRLRSNAGLTPQLVGMEGYRVEVERDDGRKARFIVGRSTGWVPCHLEIATRRSTGGVSADKKYKSVRRLSRER